MRAWCPSATVEKVHLSTLGLTSRKLNAACNPGEAKQILDIALYDTLEKSTTVWRQSSPGGYLVSGLSASWSSNKTDVENSIKRAYQHLMKKYTNYSMATEVKIAMTLQMHLDHHRR